ncbi:MAG: four helix bundle protein [Bacteroidaceae bacterium]|nr:four helix bundle protein [Bacteroidaceae bacterium]
MYKDNIIREKSYAFAIRIVNAYKFLAEGKREFVLSKQLLRSGTAVGALVAEAVHAQSGADFLDKMNIALKEANETEYWLSLLKDTNYIEMNQYESIDKDCKELVALLVSIVKSMKNTLNK